jgi:hypothetical protein
MAHLGSGMFRPVANLDHFVQQWRTNVAGRAEVVRVDGRRMLALTAELTPMVAVAAAFPVTVVLALLTEYIGKVTALWVGIVLLAAALIVLGYMAARWAVSHPGLPVTYGWRRRLPLVATVVIVAECVAEMASGSRAPTDPVIVLCLGSIAWLFAFLPLATSPRTKAHRVVWIAIPALTLVTTLFVSTQALFWLRFKLAVSDLDAVAERVVEGQKVPDGTHAGGFVLHYVQGGHIRGNEGCDAGMWITGWHQDDTRYIAHCVGEPSGNFSHLEGDWWQVNDMLRPSDL